MSHLAPQRELAISNIDKMSQKDDKMSYFLNTTKCRKKTTKCRTRHDKMSYNIVLYIIEYYTNNYILLTFIYTKNKRSR